MNKKELAKLFDHTALKAFTTPSQIEKLCAEAVKIGSASVCVNPCYIPLAKKLLENSDVMVCTVIGFPLGANTSETKAFETADAVKKGADEIDMVINIGEMTAGNYDVVLNDIKAVRAACTGKTLKVIIETAYLTDEQKTKACLLCKEAGADFVKTSTGFAPSGATQEDVKLMRAAVGKEMKVKAAGGIRTYEDVMKMIDASADRIGVSASLAILEECKD